MHTTKPTVATQILELLDKTPGLTDSDLSQLLNKRHQHINITCHKLKKKGLLTRDEKHSPVRNYLTDNNSKNTQATAFPHLSSTSPPIAQSATSICAPLSSSNINIKLFIDEFFSQAATNGIDIYNEFSLQHELGIYLRNKLPNYKVQFERNVNFFYRLSNTIKKEIDITIFNSDYSEKYAIELKHPRNGQYPEQMYSFIKDLKFMEELKHLGFTKTFAVTLVCDRPFYYGEHNEKDIYQYFRAGRTITGVIRKPTGTQNESIEIQGSYTVDWLETLSNNKYYCIEI